MKNNDGREKQDVAALAVARDGKKMKKGKEKT